MPVVIAHAHRWEFQFARRVELVVLSWRCHKCSQKKVTQLLPQADLASDIAISIKAYLELLVEGKKFDEQYPELNQSAWLVSAAWSFDDGRAYYRSPR